MGVAGAGKTTVGRRLAESLGASFVDADAHHAPESIDKMRRGEPLTDADREPWLATLRRVIAEALAHDTPLVLACSALTRAYREALVPSGAESRVWFVYLRVSREVLAARLETRAGHFAGAALLESQLATLEVPNETEHVLVVDGESPAETLVTTLRNYFVGREGSSGS